MLYVCYNGNILAGRSGTGCATVHQEHRSLLCPAPAVARIGAVPCPVPRVNVLRRAQGLQCVPSSGKRPP